MIFDSPRSPKVTLPDISVVIPTYRRPRLLIRCLNALLVQTLEAARYEILVVDDERSPETRQLVEDRARSTGACPYIVYLEPPTGARGPAAARNRGWRRALAPIVAFTDDDTVPTMAWLEEGLAAMTSDLAAVCGCVRVPGPKDPTDYQRNVQRLEQSEFVTANCFVRREALVAVGGFDERFTRAWREDSDLHFSLIERAGRVGRAPAALVLHPIRPAPWGISLREQRNMLFDALLYKKHPRLYRERIQAGPPVRYYAIIIAVAFAGIGVATSQAELEIIGLILWGGLTGAMIRRRLSGTTHTASHVAEMIITSMAIPVLAVGWRLTGAVRFRVPFM
jgi:GT2 family glycosyltransferase